MFLLAGYKAPYGVLGDARKWIDWILAPGNPTTILLATSLRLCPVKKVLIENFTLKKVNY